MDREAFGELVTATIEADGNITIIREEITRFAVDRPCIIATGPLTSPALTESILELTGAQGLHFFDAIAPSVDVETVDQDRVFRQSRYDKGEAAYLNCPMSREEYEAFIDALLEGSRTCTWRKKRTLGISRECMPVEVIARRGRETLAFGTMKLTDSPTPGRAAGLMPWSNSGRRTPRAACMGWSASRPSSGSRSRTVSSE